MQLWGTGMVLGDSRGQLGTTGRGIWAGCVTPGCVTTGMVALAWLCPDPGATVPLTQQTFG